MSIFGPSPRRRPMLPMITAISSIAVAFALVACGGGDPRPETRSEAALATASVSNPGVCDPLKAPGTTSGLFGLCVSYCQALNCPDPAVGAMQMAKQCKAAGRSVLANYNAIKKPSDPAMP